MIGPSKITGQPFSPVVPPFRC